MLAVGEVYRGPEEFGEFMRTWTEDSDEWFLEIGELLDIGNDRVLALVRQSAKGKASGAPVQLQRGVIYELRNRRMVRIGHYLDPSQGLRVAGLAG